jgi:hypothetical protein
MPAQRRLTAFRQSSITFPGNGPGVNLCSTPLVAKMSLKLTWQRVRPFLSSLLVILLVLFFFWTMGPQFVSSIGRLIDAITASPNLKPWIDDVEKNYQFFVFCSLRLLSAWGSLGGLVSGSGIRGQYHEEKN